MDQQSHQAKGHSLGEKLGVDMKMALDIRIGEYFSFFGQGIDFRLDRDPTARGPQSCLGFGRLLQLIAQRLLHQ